jgi:hypothetical protein
MNGRFNNGSVQDIVNSILPLAIQFDDDGNIDFWLAGTNCTKMPDITIDNYKNSLDNWKDVQKRVGGSNNEVAVINDILSFYRGTVLPVYVLFISDGGVSNTKALTNVIKESSRFPIFWQFVGVGGTNYGALEKLDAMDGRVVDNANFFAIDDFRTIPKSELYDKLLNEFPDWLTAAKQAGIL